MFRIVLILLSFLACASIWAQDDYQRILDRNPFDPKRGQEEAVEEEPEEEATPEVEENHNFILDGTMIFENHRLAIVSFREASESKRPNSRRKTRANGPAIASRGKVTSKVLGLQDEIQGYTLIAIEQDSVTLQSSGKQIQLTMYSEDKTSRGGTKSKSSNTKKRRVTDDERTDRLNKIREARDKAKEAAKERRENKSESNSRDGSGEKSKRFD